MDPQLSQARDRAVHAALKEVVNGMKVGLGTGDTAGRFIRALGERVRDGLSIVGVATSQSSADLARSLGIPVLAPDEVAALDLTVDGADEIDPQLRLIKGGGGAHTREKLVAHASRKLVIVADWQKKVQRLGERMRLPVEILPFSPRWTMAQLQQLGLLPELRLRDGAPVLTDNGGLIVDCALQQESDLGALAEAIKGLPGVVEHGLFLVEARVVYVGTPDDVEVLRHQSCE
jgi:ribose 5-phosphate isomerase A